MLGILGSIRPISPESVEVESLLDGFASVVGFVWQSVIRDGR